MRRIASWMAILTALGVLIFTSAPVQGKQRRLIFALTPVIVDTDVSLKSDWADYLSRKTGFDVQFVQRGSYREVLLMVQYGDVDLAWICGYPFVRNADLLQLVAVPLYQGEPYYRSYTIVSASSPSRSLAQLKGKLHAFSELDSNSGHLVPRFLLTQRGTTPEQFFNHYIFTFSHENVVRAVANGLTDSGSVDGYVWDVLNRTDASLRGRTRVIHRSDRYGFPPIVAHRAMAAERVAEFRSLLIGMSADPEGRRILSRLSLDGFSPESEDLYAGIAHIMREVNDFQASKPIARN